MSTCKYSCNAWAYDLNHLNRLFLRIGLASVHGRAGQTRVPSNNRWQQLTYGTGVCSLVARGGQTVRTNVQKVAFFNG